MNILRVNEQIFQMIYFLTFSFQVKKNFKEKKGEIKKCHVFLFTFYTFLVSRNKALFSEAHEHMFLSSKICHKL